MYVPIINVLPTYSMWRAEFIFPYFSLFFLILFFCIHDLKLISVQNIVLRDSRRFYFAFHFLVFSFQFLIFTFAYGSSPAYLLLYKRMLMMLVS